MRSCSAVARAMEADRSGELAKLDGVSLSTRLIDDQGVLSKFRPSGDCPQGSKNDGQLMWYYATVLRLFIAAE